MLKKLSIMSINGYEVVVNMKIKIALLDNDTRYLNRIVAAFNAKYADKLEIYSFTKTEGLNLVIEANKIDVLIASDVCDVETETLPKRCGFAYFVESHDIETMKGKQAICKFQKADLIYKQILSIYSENVSDVFGVKISDEDCNLTTFVSPSGGVGTSTLAAAYAVACAKNGKSVLYLNLEIFGAADSFFYAEGQFDMSDIIYSIKSKKSNIALKIESTIKQDKTGVYFFSQPKMALDVMELNTDEILNLLKELRISGKFQTIVLDMGFDLDSKKLEVYKNANQIILVGDGTEISNAKLLRAYQSLIALEQGMDMPLSGKMSILYNKFSNKTGHLLENIDMKALGGAPRFEHASIREIVVQLAAMNIFDKIM